MALWRSVCAWSLVLSAAGLVPACGSDDDPPPSGTGAKAGSGGRGGSAGSSAGRGGSAGGMGSGGGGMAGSGGSSGATGSGGRGGSAGTNGTAGSSGTAGDASAGTAGTAGTAGSDAGPDTSTGGTAGADAAPDTSVDGTAGSDAGSDAGNDAPSDTSDAAAAGECIERCTTDNDCRKNDAGSAGVGCRDNRCVSLSTYCASTDADCVPEASGWGTACSASSPCPAVPPTQVCINIGGGVGRCALQEGSGPCALLPNIASMPKLDGSGNVNVCADTSNRCNPTTHTCTPDCTINGCPTNTACNTTTKRCGCTSSAACAPRPGTPSCNTATGACECATDTDCNAANVDGDVCVNGKCRCSGISACIKSFDGTTETCE
jgi:hypothetical protein